MLSLLSCARAQALEFIGNVAKRLNEKQAKEIIETMPINSWEDFLQLFQGMSDEGMWDKITVDEYVRVGDHIRESKTVNLSQHIQYTLD